MMRYLSEQSLITCILPKGTSLPLLPRLKHELGLLTAHLNSARGFGRSAQDTHASHAQSEKELLTVVTSRAQADAVFNWLFEEAAMVPGLDCNTAQNGFRPSLRGFITSGLRHASRPGESAR